LAFAPKSGAGVVAVVVAVAVAVDVAQPASIAAIRAQANTAAGGFRLIVFVSITM
jgi:hypothetical protein